MIVMTASLKNANVVAKRVQTQKKKEKEQTSSQWLETRVKRGQKNTTTSAHMTRKQGGKKKAPNNWMLGPYRVEDTKKGRKKPKKKKKLKIKNKK